MSWKTIATDLIARFEGLHKLDSDHLVHPYLDTLAKPPRWTRGYGRTYGITKDSKPITKAQAKSELEDGVINYGVRCAILAPNVTINDNCFAAITSWAWNCGLTAFKLSRLRRSINESRWDDALTYIKSPKTAGGKVYKGLIIRRNAEYQLFLSGLQQS